MNDYQQTGDRRAPRACAARQPASPRRRSRSTAPGRRSRTRSTRSGSPSTTSCTPTSRSTTSRSARAAASGRSPTQTVFFGATDGPMTDEQLQAAPGKILHFPTVLGAVVPVYNIPGVTAELKFTRAGARRHLPRQDHEVERPGDRQAEPRRHAAGHRHHRRAPLGRLGHDLHLGRLPRQGLAGVEEQGRRGHGGELADRRRRQGQRGRGRAGQADAGRDRLRRADLRAAEQDRLRRGAERRRRVREGVGRSR